MPITPLHFGPGLALKSVTGEWFSFTLFCFVQVLIDLEPAWYMLAGDDYIHRFLHTYFGATLAGAVAGGLIGGWSHVFLDSLMHADMRPLAPWGGGNALLFLIHVDTLYIVCAVAGAAGLGLVLFNRWRGLRGTRSG